MKQKDNTNTKQGHSANMLLYAVAPTPKLSTDAIALEGAVVSRGNGIGATSETYLMDCIVGMKHYPDKYFDLAVVDPPYGIDIVDEFKKTVKSSSSMFNMSNGITGKSEWDKAIPTLEYFTELFRVSNNQIIWGGNYFIEYLSNTRCMLVWDKMNGTNPMADAELAWTSFTKSVKMFRMHHFSSGYDDKIHPTQKPVLLLEDLIKTFSNEGNLVVDLTMGSGSTGVACKNSNRSFIGIEKDEAYFKIAEQRINALTLF